MPETCIFYDLNIEEVLYQVGHAADHKRLGLIRVRIFKNALGRYRLRMTI